MKELYTVIIITTLATISPGASFAMVLRNTICFGRKGGIFTAFGVSIATWIHTAYCITGVALIISNSSYLFNMIKVIGAIYLLYIGMCTFRSKPNINNSLIKEEYKKNYIRAFNQGFLSNFTNPKTTLFYLSIFTIAVNKDTPLLVQLNYGLIIFVIHIIWFGLISYLFSNCAIRNSVGNKISIVNKAVGFFLIIISIKLTSSVIF